MNTRAKFAQACAEYIEAFCQKHFDCGVGECEIFWVRDEVGGILMLNDYFLSFLDLKYDIDHDVPKDQFFAWYDYALRVKAATDTDINYQSYLAGFRVQNLDRIEALQKEVFNLIEQTKNEVNSTLGKDFDSGTRS